MNRERVEMASNKGRVGAGRRLVEWRRGTWEIPRQAPSASLNLVKQQVLQNTSSHSSILRERSIRYGAVYVAGRQARTLRGPRNIERRKRMPRQRVLYHLLQDACCQQRLWPFENQSCTSRPQSSRRLAAISQRPRICRTIARHHLLFLQCHGTYSVQAVPGAHAGERGQFERCRREATQDPRYAPQSSGQDPGPARQRRHARNVWNDG
jgi:hypothetical protein